MELSIEKEHENKIFERKEILASASFDSKTPTRQEIKEALCRKKNLDPEMVEIISIDQEYGRKRCSITAYEYSTKEAKQKGAFRISAKSKEKPAGAAPAAEKKAEENAKKDEKKEESTEEKKEGQKEPKAAKNTTEKGHAPEGPEKKEEHKKEQ